MKKLLISLVLASSALVFAQDNPGKIAMPAEYAALEALPLPKLEETYWACDYKATVAVASGYEGQVCVIAYEILKKKKFNGDYGEFIKWWQAQKSVEYAKQALKP